MHSFQRKEILQSIATQIKQREQELAYALCIEVGKPIKDATVEVARYLPQSPILTVPRIGQLMCLQLQQKSQFETEENFRKWTSHKGTRVTVGLHPGFQVS
jgi:hypothetical protein